MLPMGPDTRILLTASRHSSAVLDEPTYLHTTRGLLTRGHVSRVSSPRHVVPVAVSELLEPVQQLHQLLGRPVVVQRGEVAVVHELHTIT